MSAKKSTTIFFAETELVLDAACALYWPAKCLLVITDMHLEKGSFFAEQGNPIPLYDTFDTLKRLEQLIAIYKPKSIISLGDNIHDIKAFLRMNKENNSLLHTLTDSVDQWIWLAGNHDRHVLPKLQNNLYCCSDYNLAPLFFSHDFNKNYQNQIIGHYHPQVSYRGIKGKCFIVSPNLIILPAFGTYTGGLNVDSPAFKKLIRDNNYKTYLSHRNKLWQVI